jgi:hypothetical protein
MFASREQLKVLLHSNVLFADGTFKVSPKLFEQLYVIHGLANEEGRYKYIYIYTYISFFVLQSLMSVHA